MAARLTIGMAHHTDYDGVYFTLHALREYHPTDGVELLVVDNSPGKPAGRAVGELCEQMGAKYVPYADAVGTSAPRDRVFAEASGEVVLCIDCHVLLPRGAVQNLLDFWESHDGRSDMITGPLLNDAGGLYADHFDDVWRAEMWGIWGLAWRCKCGENGVRFSVLEPTDPTTEPAVYRELLSQEPVERCEYCHAKLPTDVPYFGHQAKLDAAGYRPALADGRAFAIPGMGLGLFSMRRDAWVGFNADALGFGGEELYVHEKVRRAGGRVLCLPGLPWKHRFFRPDGPRYPLDRYGKARNYVLEYNELGLDLEPIRAHFVADAMLTPAEWEHLVADPVANKISPRAEQPSGGCGGCGKAAGRQPGDDVASLEELVGFLTQEAPRDLDKHAEYVGDLVGRVDHATLIVKRREWDIFAAAARPARLISYNAEGADPIIGRLAEIIQRTETNPRAARRIKTYTRSTVKPENVTELDERTELLVLDSIHSASHIFAELSRFADMVSRYILVRGTGAFGLKAEGSDAPGLLVGIRQFCRERTAWSVLEHRADQYGLTLLGCLEADKPKRPSVLKLAANFAKHAAEYVADGMKQADAETYENRLGICSLCTERNGDHCSVCGCAIAAKAKWRAMECDLGYWPTTDVDAADTADQVQREVDR